MIPFNKPSFTGNEERYILQAIRSDKISGDGVFTTGDTAPRRCGPGDVVHHTPYLPHSIDMSEGPLLVLFLWHGANLHKKSAF